ncbi:MAG: carboxypeptidase regulatory-like domain-containing protein [Planctomycetota bacterium]
MSAHRVVEVTAAWPDPARPSNPPLVVAFDSMLSGQDALSALQRALPDGVERRQPVAEVIFEELENDDSIPDETRVLFAAPLTRGADGEWRAGLEIPSGSGRVFLHAAGHGFWTPETTLLDARELTAEVRLARGGRVAVRVQRSPATNGAALEDTLVRVEEPSDFLRDAQRARTRAGRFSVDVTVDADGAAPPLTVPAGVQLVVRGEHPTETANEPAPFDVAGGQTFDVGLRLMPGATMTGRVLLPGGDPAPAGLTVQALRPGKAFGLDDVVLRATETDDAGAFIFSGLDGSRFRVRAASERYLDARSNVIELDGGAKALDGIELQLGTGRSIEGRVVGPDGEGRTDLEVEAVVDAAQLMGIGAMTAMSGPRGRTRTDAEGAFEVTGLGAGPFTVRAFDADGAVVARADDVAPQTDGLVLHAMAPAALRGRVVDDSERTVSEVEIRLARVSNAQIGEVRIERRAARSAEDGTFTFGDLSEGTYELWVRTETHATLETQRVRVEHDAAPEPIVLVAPRAASASGVVADANGRPKAGALVTLFDTGRSQYTPAQVAGPVVESTRTDAQGRFEVLGLPALELQLEATHPEHPSARSKAFTLSPGEERTGVGIVLSTGGAVEGICFDADGNPAADRLLSANHIRLQQAVTGRSRSDGTFELTGLAPGTWQLVAMDPSLSMSTDEGEADMGAMLQDIRMKPVEIVDGETKFVFLGSPAAESVEVTGRVAAGGLPAEGRVLSWFGGASKDAEVFKGARTNADGRYTVELPGPGTYLVMCSAVGSTLDKGQSLEFSVTVPEGATRFEHDIELPRARISGRVLGPDGEPAVGERVTLVPDAGPTVGGLRGRGYGELRTLGGGTFSFENVAAGRYFVSAGGSSIFGERPDAPGRVSVGPFEIDADVALEDVEVRLVAAGALRVRVVDGSGTPVVGASLFVERTDGKTLDYVSMHTTGSTGQRTITGLAPGDFIVSARSEDGAARDLGPVTVNAGETEEVELLVGPGTMLEVRTIAPDEVAHGTVELQVLDTEGRDHARRISGIEFNRSYQEGVQSDRRTVGPLPPGRYRVIASAPGGFDGKKQVILKADEKTDSVTVRLR